MAILDFDKNRWLAALGWSQDDVPDVLVLEGTWWRERAVRQRLAALQDVAQTAFPDIHTGSYGPARLAYSCAYGAARAAEVAHLCAQAGVPLVIQIGTCGSLQPGIGTGTIAVPRAALARDGVTASYGGAPRIALSERWGAVAAGLIGRQGIPLSRGLHLTWTTLFAQSDALCRGWTAEGIATVDMETAAVGAVAARFGAEAIALLAAWDLLGEGRTFLDPVQPDEARALARADAATWATALEIATQVAAARSNTPIRGAVA